MLGLRVGLEFAALPPVLEPHLDAPRRHAEVHRQLEPLLHVGVWLPLKSGDEHADLLLGEIDSLCDLGIGRVAQRAHQVRAHRSLCCLLQG